MGRRHGPNSRSDPAPQALSNQPMTGHNGEACYCIEQNGGGGGVLELEEKVEGLESVVAQLKVDIKELLVDFKELSLRGQNPMMLKLPRESVARINS